MSLRELPLSRRALLTGTVVAAVAACTSRPGRPAADPDAAALAAARETELQLLAAYDVAHPARAAHLAHLQALGGVAPSGPPTAVPVAAAAAAERASVAPLQAAAGAARRGSDAALLASIAASHAVLGQGHP